jgi:predicted nucleic acid-binding protein
VIESGGPLPAVLDTFYWTAAHRADVAANSLALFRIVVPRAVEAEITRVSTDDPRREYPYTTLFLQLRDKMLEPPPDAPAPLEMFGGGEAEAITLAQHLGIALLINDHRPREFARALRIPTITVPTMILTLCARGVISKRAATRKLDLIEPITSASIIGPARASLETL